MLSVVVPAFREGEKIYEALKVLRASLDDLNRPYEIIVVSDGSDDDTLVEASRHEGIAVHQYDRQRGKGYAVRYGIQLAQGEHIAFIDADMELHPDGIGPLLALVENDFDAAIGSKRHAGSQVQYPLFRRFQSAVYQLLIRALFDLNVTDTQTGLKVFRADILRSVAPELTSDGFAFDLELLVALRERGARIVEGPVILDYTFDTTTGARAVFDVLRDTWTIWCKHRRHRRRPVRRAA